MFVCMTLMFIVVGIIITSYVMLEKDLEHKKIQERKESIEK